MASHFKWYPSSEEVVVPFNARYSFPSQANKAVKITPRIPPKTGAQFTPGSIIRVEFPAQGYVNPQNTTLEFDVTLYGFAGRNLGGVWFQNNIQSIFQRVRLLYGATPLEDIINYDVVVRALTEWTSTEQMSSLDQTSIAEGIGGTIYGMPGVNPEFEPNTMAGFGSIYAPCHSRRDIIHGTHTDHFTSTVPTPGFKGGAANDAKTNQQICTRRYQVNFALGLFTQDKLIPCKFMASQLAIELTLAQPSQCMIAIPSLVTTIPGTGPAGTNLNLGISPAQATAVWPVLAPPILAPVGTYNLEFTDITLPTSQADVTYVVSSVNLIPEILEFDASYDAMFLKGLREGGVPIKFSSWHTFIFSNGQSSTLNLLIQERSRSVKSIFTVQRRATPSILVDSGAMHFATLTLGRATTTLLNYQYRIGGRYFPASPVITSTGSGVGAVSNGGAEAFVELQKCLNTMGDYRLTTSVNTLRWALQPASTFFGYTGFSLADQNQCYTGETDYNEVFSRNGDDGRPLTRNAQWIRGSKITAGNMGSACFAMSTNLETSSGVEISGLNAEEQSDISLIANYSGPQFDGTTNFNMETYSFYDAMLILRENNVLELIQ